MKNPRREIKFSGIEFKVLTDFRYEIERILRFSLALRLGKVILS